METERTADLDRVRRTLAGDRDAFGELVTGWQDRIYGAIFRMVRDRELTRDLAQETFLRAYAKLESFQGGSSFGTWLYSIAVNQVRSEMRKRSALKNRPPRSLEALGAGDEGRDFDPADSGPGAEERAATKEHCALLLTAVDELEDDYREVVVLREFQNLSYEDIAEAVSVPVGTVRSRLHRARNELRTRLKDRVFA